MVNAGSSIPPCLGVIIALLAYSSTCCQAQSDPTVTVRPVEPRTPTVTVRPAPATTEPASQSAVLLVIDDKIVPSESLELVRGQQVMIWIRELQNLGWGTVSAASGGRSVLKGNGVSLSFKAGESTAMVNSLSVKLPVNVYSKAGKTMVPLSFVAKSLGMKYDLAIRPVATITTGSATLAGGHNTIEGTAVFNGKAVSGLVVRVTDEEMKVVDGATARSRSDGTFTIGNLPDGKYYAYIYSGDNPEYFNRQSKLISVSGGETARVEPIRLGRIIQPKSPATGAEVSPVQGAVKFSWSSCEGTATYKLTIRAQSDRRTVAQLTSQSPSATVRADTLTAGTRYEAEVEAHNADGEYIGGTPGSGAYPWVFGVR